MLAHLLSFLKKKQEKPCSSRTRALPPGFGKQALGNIKRSRDDDRPQAMVRGEDQEIFFIIL
jgi:hypothetical protein